jgi:diketogulonate reductase-like aldo/keto reductase
VGLTVAYGLLCPDATNIDRASFLQLDWLDTWKKMERVYKANPEKIRAIGVSNFSIEFLERLLPEVTVIPAVNQIELHPYVVILRSSFSQYQQLIDEYSIIIDISML